MESFINKVCPDKDMRILDVGFSDNEYSPTDNFIEKHYPYPQNLTALGIDTPQYFKKRYPKVNVVQYDGTFFPFKDKVFDYCWSNAVIEHVGGFDKQLFFLNEICRVSKKAFITTPNKFFPIELHTRTPILHYLPKNLFDGYLSLAGKKWASGNYMHLLSAKNIKSLLRESAVADYKIYNNKLLGFTLDFVVIFNSK